MPARPRSELEGFVLGLTWQLGPASPYEVRRRMLESPSTQWSGSAGAIYPLMRRLERAGLLASRAERAGKRKRRVYTVTPKGLAALRAWVGPPLGKDAVTVAHDPLRSRARFLAALPPSQRQEWIDAARGVLDEVERSVRDWARKHAAAPAEPLARAAALMTRSGEIDVESRRRWLDAVAEARW